MARQHVRPSRGCRAFCYLQRYLPRHHSQIVQGDQLVRLSYEVGVRLPAVRFTRPIAGVSAVCGSEPLTLNPENGLHEVGGSIPPGKLRSLDHNQLPYQRIANA